MRVMRCELVMHDCEMFKQLECRFQRGLLMMVNNLERFLQLRGIIQMLHLLTSILKTPRICRTANLRIREIISAQKKLRTDCVLKHNFKLFDKLFSFIFTFTCTFYNLYK